MGAVDAGRYYERTYDGLDESLTPTRRFMRAYEQGLSDGETARQVLGTGRKYGIVKRWREKCGLPENTPKGATMEDEITVRGRVRLAAEAYAPDVELTKGMTRAAAIMHSLSAEQREAVEIVVRQMDADEKDGGAEI